LGSSWWTMYTFWPVGRGMGWRRRWPLTRRLGGWGRTAQGPHKTFIIPRIAILPHPPSLLVNGQRLLQPIPRPTGQKVYIVHQAMPKLYIILTLNYKCSIRTTVEGPKAYTFKKLFYLGSEVDSTYTYILRRIWHPIPTRLCIVAFFDFYYYY